MKKTVLLMMVLAGGIALSVSFAQAAKESASQATTVRAEKTTTLRPKTRVLAPKPHALVCAQISNALQQDKRELSEVLADLAEHDCYNTNVPPSATCTRLLYKKKALTQRIAANERRAAAEHCH